MPTIPYSAVNFPLENFPTLPAAGVLTFTWPRLVWAATTVGKAEEHQAASGIYSAYERSMRTALVYANLMESATGQLIKAPNYETLDPSEKTAVSFYLGMTIVRLISYSLLNVPWLLHLDLYKNTIVAPLEGRSRPDFVGRNEEGQWLVLESKGRSDFVTATAMATLMAGAKGQAALLGEINGGPPVANIGAVTHFMNDGRLRFDMNDPPAEEDKKKRLELNVSDVAFSRNYYAPFLESLGHAKQATFPVDGRRVRTLDFTQLDVTIGIDEAVVDAIGIDGPTLGHQYETDREFLGKDGVFVRLGGNWSQANMRRPPTERQ